MHKNYKNILFVHVHNVTFNFTFLTKEFVIFQIVSLLIYFGALVWSTTKLFNAYPKKGFYARPSMILALVAVIFQLLYVITFAYKFGVKTNDVQVMLNSGDFQPMHTKESKMVLADHLI